jgi:hypothetical protein
MKFTARIISIARQITFIAALTLGFTAHAQSVDYTKHWTTVGSAGTVDEADVSKIEFSKSAVQLKGSGPIVVQRLQNAEAATTDTRGSEATPDAVSEAIISQPTENAIVRYNVTPVDGLFTASPYGIGYNALGMTVRYMAIQGRVTVRLVEVDVFTGVEVERMKFDSATQPTVNGYVTRSVGYPLPNWKFNFEQKAYYIEATLSRSSIIAGGSAGLAVVKLNAYYQIT